jgi:hypothetical protein
MLILLGTDPTLHFGLAQPLIDNAINFAAAGVDRTGAQKTGLYFALSCYYDTRAGPVPVELVTLSLSFLSLPSQSPSTIDITN